MTRGILPLITGAGTQEHSDFKETKNEHTWIQCRGVAEQSD